MSSDELKQAMIDALAGRPLSRDELIESMTASSGRGVADDVSRLLQFDTTFGELSSGIVYTPSLLEGTTWTVPIDGDDARDGFVRIHPNLTHLGWWLINDDVELRDADGQVIGTHETDGILLDDVDTDVLYGPDGWLEPLGELASVEVRDGTLRWSPVDDRSEPTAAQRATLDAGFDVAVRSEAALKDPRPASSGLEYDSLDIVVLEALVADREAFTDRRVPPLVDLLDDAGFEIRRDDVARAGFDWTGLDTWRATNRMVSLYGLDREEAEGFAMVWGAARLVVEGDVDAFGTDDEERESAAAVLAACLDAPSVAAALWSRHVDEGGSATDLGRFARALRERLGEVPADGLDWLEARCLDHAGDVDAAVERLDAARLRGSKHRLVLVESARHASDRGDAVEALRLLRAAGVDGEVDDDDDGYMDDVDPEISLFHEVVDYATHRPRPAARRNDPCPCGSGRKYKVCHLGKETFPLEERAPWLMQKAERFARDRAPSAFHQLADAVIEPYTDFATNRALRDAPFVGDLVLHEYGLFEEFLATRSHRLPDDEALLAAQWELVDRAVFEVVDDRRTSLGLRDIAGGEEIRVVNVHAGEQISTGSVLVGRPLPVGDTYRSFSGFIPLPRRHVDAMLDAIATSDPFEIAAVLGHQFVPPTLTNTDGEPMLLHTLRWRLPAGTVDDLHTAFHDIGLDHDDADPPTWRLVRDTESMPRATILVYRLEGDELICDANSAERAELAEALVDEALGDAELIDVDRRTMEEAALAVDLDDRSEPLDQSDPAIREVLERFVAEMEERWLDESIPALGGRTPREAVKDPVGREEVEQLLASFPSLTGDEPGMMDPDRLRRALGLA
jgi:SEC-C motif